MWAFIAGLSVTFAAAPTTDRNPLVLIGIDGLEPAVLEAMWAEGELPHMKALANKGTWSKLATDYQSKSPVVWTTVATGHTAERHGITDFVSSVSGNEIPVSSSDRMVESLWTIGSRANLEVLQLGWWASWPAEPVKGINVTSRATMELPKLVWPKELADDLPDWQAQAEQAYGDIFPGDDLAGPADRLYTWLAADQLGYKHWDLTMVYLHRVDLASHRWFKYFDPTQRKLPDVSDDPHGQLFFDSYRAVDAAVGAIVEAAPPKSNIVVVSDHGFMGLDEYFIVHFKLERVFKTLKLWNGGVEGARWHRTSVYVVDSPSMRAEKKVRVNLIGREEYGIVAREHFDEVLDDLQDDLSRVVWGHSGEPVFSFREPRDDEDCDLVVIVDTSDPSETILLDGENAGNAVLEIVQHSGTHNGEQPGVLIAAGPDVARRAELDDPSIFDITPTVLHGLGLEVGQDMSGRVLTDLFKGSVKKTPVAYRDTWELGARRPRATESAMDQELVDALRALGYLE